MIRTWPGQTEEQWIKECRRDQHLTQRERDLEIREHLRQLDKKLERHKTMLQVNEGEDKKPPSERFDNYDHPDSLGNKVATVIWLIVMGVGAIFKGNWVIWIITTWIWIKYITRHHKKK